MGKTTNAILSILGKHTGQLTRLMFNRRIVDNEIKSVRRLSGLIEELNSKESVVSFSKGQWSIEPKSAESVAIWKNDVADDIPSPDSLPARTLNQLLAQSAIKQRNLEYVSTYALLDSMENEEKEGEATSQKPVGIKDVDETWLNSFFEYAQRISDREAQQIWGRILSGEVKSPGSYSLRTLSTLANISKEEAELFQKIAERRMRQIQSTGLSIPYLLHDNSSVGDFWPISYLDLLQLKSAGLIALGETSSLIFSPLADGERNDIIAFIYGKRLVVIRRKNPSAKLHLSVSIFTTAGAELSRLIPTRFDPSIKVPLAKWEKNLNLEISTCREFSYDKGVINFEDSSLELIAELEP